MATFYSSLGKKHIRHPQVVCCCLDAKPCLMLCPRTEACQAPPSMRLPKQEDWGGLPSPPPGDLPDLGIEPASLVSPALAGGFLTTSHWFINTQMPHRRAHKMQTVGAPSKELPPQVGWSVQPSRPLGHLPLPGAGMLDARPLWLCQSSLLP